MSNMERVYEVEIWDMSHNNKRTIVGLFKDHDRAIQRARRLGKVLSCRKVSADYYTNNIEHLNLHQKPLTVELELEPEFTITKALELTNPQIDEPKYGIEVIDRGE